MRKMDEMEKSIALQSMRWSWGFGVISLAIYNIFQQITTGQTSFSFIIMIGMILIQRGIYHYKLQQVNEDQSFWRGLLLVLLIVLLMLGGLFLISGL
jgi:hypothetical protein